VHSYLKNVMVRLVQFDDKPDERQARDCGRLAGPGRSHAVAQALYPVIATILHFGPEARPHAAPARRAAVC
jgi:hypothetical protein